MTVDNTKPATLVLAANAAPAVLTMKPFDNERGSTIGQQGNVCSFDQCERGWQRKPALTGSQKEHQRKHLQQEESQQCWSEDTSIDKARPSSTINIMVNSVDSDAAADDDAPALEPIKEAFTDPLQQQQQQVEQTAAAAVAPAMNPKWVRVGSKVRFSTVVAAVLIPSSRDLNASTKRELWWQSVDYQEFRFNYAMHMHNPSIELEEQEREEAAGAAAPPVPVAANADGPANRPTATVEGVLVVAASPAPAPLTSHGGGGGSGGAAAPSQDRVSKTFRHERAARPGPSTSSLEKQQRKAMKGRHRNGSSAGSGYTALPPKHAAYVSHPKQFHGAHHQHNQHQQPVVTRDHPGPDYGRLNARTDLHFAPRGVNQQFYQHQQLYHRTQYARVGGVAGTVHHGHHHQLQHQHHFYVNSNPAAVDCAPAQQPHQVHMTPAVAAEGRYGAALSAPRPGAAFSSARRAGVVCAAVAGHKPVSVRVGVGGSGPSSQFSMWRSQLVFAPAMQMQ